MVQINSVNQAAQTVIGNRYVLLDTLGEGGMGIVYRVRDRLTGALLALKKVTQSANALEFAMATSAQDTSSLALALANEFQILARLRHPHIVSVLDYGFDADRQPYFTMDLVLNPQRITDAAQGQSQQERVRLLIQLLEALAYLHRRGIIHRDLKPQNVLVDDSRQVRVLDFGLALSEQYVRKTDDTLHGTFAYMAPEILRGEGAQVASDLYGFGIIAYQVLSGSFPYDLSNISSLIRIILEEPPDLSPFEPAIANFLGRLLAKSTDDRYRDVDETIQALCDAADYPHPHETVAIRESYLQSAPLVGRETVVQELLNRMSAAQAGKGSICLLEGESGVGKSRLLDELRVRALVQNLLVLQGQEIAEGNNPYQVWRGVVQWLCLTADLTELEMQVLKDLVPNISDILQMDVTNAPELSGQAAQDRLINVVANIFRRQPKPTMVILEDLQWAGEESLRLLKALVTVAAESHILILGSYRSDQAPHLVDLVPGAEVLRLNRLDQAEIAAIVHSISGVSELEPQVLAFLQHEAEGNAFFVIETVRMLADAAGELRKINKALVDKAIVAGGVMAVLQQRLQHVHDDARDLLEVAAIIGREIDLPLLKNLAPAMELQTWLIICADAAVLEAQENRWYFAHDKLREFLVVRLQESADKLRLLHARVAVGMEAVYGDQETYTAALAYHYTQAQIADKAVAYLEKAALQARIGAPSTVIEYVEKALEFDAVLGTISPMRQARRHSLLGNAYYGLGDYKRAEIHLQAATKYMGAPTTPDASLPLIGAVVQQIGVQFLHRRVPSRYLGLRSSADVDSSIYTALFNKQVVYSYQGNILKVLHAGLVALNTVETLEMSEVANPTMAYAALSLATGLMGLHSLASYYRQLTNDVLPQAGTHQKVLSRALLGMYASQRADWDEALETITLVVDRFNSMGAFHSADESVSYLGRVYAHRGDYDRALELIIGSYKRAKQRNDPIVRFQLFVMAVLLLIRKKNLTRDTFEDVVNLDDVTVAEVSFKEAFDANVLNRAVYHGMRALYFAALGVDGEAYHSIDECARLSLERKLERSVLYYELYAVLTQVSFTLLSSRVLTSSEQARVEQIFESAVKKLAQYAKTFTLAQPRAHLYQGWQRQRGGKAAQAHEFWQKSLQSAHALQMPYEAGLAHKALAQFAGISETERHSHAEQARQLFERLGAEYDLALLKDQMQV